MCGFKNIIEHEHEPLSEKNPKNLCLVHLLQASNVVFTSRASVAQGFPRPALPVYCQDLNPCSELESFIIAPHAGKVMSGASVRFAVGRGAGAEQRV